MSKERHILQFQPNEERIIGLKKLYETLEKDVTMIIHEKIPQKIIELDLYLKCEEEYDKILRSSGKMIQSSPAEGKSHVINAEEIRDSDELFAFAMIKYEKLEAEMILIARLMSEIRLWISLRVPRIEDGNNFGVSIQTDCVDFLSRIEDTALLYCDIWTKYILERAKILSKQQKYSESMSTVGAYEIVLHHMDTKMIQDLRFGWVDLRSNYIRALDVLMKNMEKILVPRTSNTDGMY